MRIPCGDTPRGILRIYGATCRMVSCYGLPMNTTKRPEYRCNKCGRIVRDWGRTGHWQTHQSGWSPDHTPRGALDVMFTKVSA